MKQVETLLDNIDMFWSPAPLINCDELIPSNLDDADIFKTTTLNIYREIVMITLAMRFMKEQVDDTSIPAEIRKLIVHQYETMGKTVKDLRGVLIRLDVLLKGYEIKEEMF